MCCGCRHATQIGGNEDVHDRQGGCVFSAAGCARPQACKPAAASTTARHGHDQRALVRRIAIVNKGDQRREARIVIRRRGSRKPVLELDSPLRRIACMDIVGGKFADGRLLLHIGEAQLATGHRRREIVKGRLLPAGPLKERLPGQLRSVKPTAANRVHGNIRRQQRHVPECAAVEFQVVPRLVRHDEGDGLA